MNTTISKKCLVYRGCGKEGQFIRVYYNAQLRPGIMMSNEVIEERLPGLIKDGYRAEP